MTSYVILEFGDVLGASTWSDNSANYTTYIYYRYYNNSVGSSVFGHTCIQTPEAPMRMKLWSEGDRRGGFRSFYLPSISASHTCTAAPIKKVIPNRLGADSQGIYCP